jgi:hypothetical protein
MIHFLRMPTNSIFILCEPDELIHSRTRLIQQDYPPDSVSIIAKANDSIIKPSFIESTFRHLRIKETDQYRPGDELINFMNRFCDTLVFIDKFSFPDRVKQSHPILEKEAAGIYLPKGMQDSLLLYGSRRGLNPCDVLRELAEFYISIQYSMDHNEDISKKIDSLNKYIVYRR